MHPSQRAARSGRAMQRLTQAAGTLAKRFDLTAEAEAISAARHRTTELDTLYKAEALADLLESLVTATKPKSKPKSEPKSTDAGDGEKATG